MKFAYIALLGTFGAVSTKPALLSDLDDLDTEIDEMYRRAIPWKEFNKFEGEGKEIYHTFMENLPKLQAEAMFDPLVWKWMFKYPKYIPEFQAWI